jgi:hypothetical protein
MQTDYKIAKEIIQTAEVFKEMEVEVECIETFRRYLTPIAKKAAMKFTTEKVNDKSLKIIRLR